MDANTYLFAGTITSICLYCGLKTIKYIFRNKFWEKHRCDNCHIIKEYRIR